MARNDSKKMVRGPVVKDARYPPHETMEIIYRSRRIERDFDRPSFFDCHVDDAIWGFFLGEKIEGVYL